MSSCDLIQRHSIFPLIASFFPPEASERWRHRLAAGNPHLYQRFLAAVRHSIPTCERLRQCPACVREDIAKFGSGHWRVVHQVPGIRFCGVHNQLLHDRCGRCRSRLGEAPTWRLPGEPCHRCGSCETSSSLQDSVSEGYTAMAALVERAIGGDAPELAPGTSIRFLRHFIDSAHSDPKSLLLDFLKYWSCREANHLERLISSSEGTIARTRLFVDGYATGNVPLLVAAIAYVCAHTSETDRGTLLQLGESEEEVSDLAGMTLRLEDSLHAELAALACRYNIPSHAADLLAAGKRHRAANLVGGLNVFILLDGLSLKSQQQFDRHTQFARSDRSKANKVG